jgi:hypothetical protein
MLGAVTFRQVLKYQMPFVDKEAVALTPAWQTGQIRSCVDSTVACWKSGVVRIRHFFSDYAGEHTWFDSCRSCKWGHFW